MQMFIRVKTLFRQRILINRRELLSRVKQSLVTLKKALAQETTETKVMLSTYQRYRKGMATEEEMREANEQFKDLLRGLGLSVFAILPFSPITIPAIVKLGRKVGVEVLPSSFKSDKLEVQQPALSETTPESPTQSIPLNPNIKADQNI